MDLFEYMREQNKEKESPLASRMRPKTLEEVVGQSHIIGKDKLLYRAIVADKLSSIILYGPPGTGKTTLAKVIAGTTSANFVPLNATTSGKKDMEEVVTELQFYYDGILLKQNEIIDALVQRVEKLEQSVPTKRNPFEVDVVATKESLWKLKETILGIFR